MLFGLDPQQIAFVLLVAVAAGSVVLVLALPVLGTSRSEERIRALSSERRASLPARQSALSRLVDGEKDSRRRQVQESLKHSEERSRPQRRGIALRTLIGRSGLGVSVRKFWIASVIAGLLFAVLPLLFGLPLIVSVLSGIVGCLGLPRWFLSSLAKRRQAAFLEGLADAVDVMVRSLKAGLPLTDAMRVIATEAEAPIGPEFLEVVEGQRVGVTIDQGLERMFERIPIPEVSFLGIVISIQSKSGGNLSEALGNLSRVLRDRKKLKSKVRAMSQEAKSSAAIIGVLPFFIIGGMAFVSPKYLEPLFSTGTGHYLLVGCAVWMMFGIMIMRNMINFDI